MHALASIALGLTEIVLDRSASSVQRTVESVVLRLGLVAACVALGCAAGGFFLAALYDLTAAAWGAIPAKLVLGGVLASLGLAGALALALSRPRDRRRFIRRL